MALNRITPAYAGQISREDSFTGGAEDHPRIRGTNQITEKDLVDVSGSPPHTRDKFPVSDVNIRGLRITPAYAGQIRFLKTTGLVEEDHPRIRGTN